VKSGAWKVNPVAGVEVSRTGQAQMIFLEPDQIMLLAAEMMAPPARCRREERRRDGYLDVDGETATLGAGDCVLLPAGTPHRLLRVEPATSWLAVYLRPDGK